MVNDAAKGPGKVREHGDDQSLVDPIQRLLGSGYEELCRQAIEDLSLSPALERRFSALLNCLARLRGARRMERDLNPVGQEAVFLQGG